MAMYRSKPLSMKKQDVLQRMTARDFAHLGKEMDKRYEYLKEVCEFVKKFGQKALVGEHKEAFEREFGTEEVKDIDMALMYADWRLNPRAIRGLYRAATKSATLRYRRGDRE